jgi:uncharacterized protein (TIGR04222 family)
MGWLLILRLDDSVYRSLPRASLTPFEIAALRDGRKGIIYTALFSLWQHQRVTIFGNIYEAKIKAISLESPPDKFEQIIFNFIGQQTRSATEFFENTFLTLQLDKAIEPLNQKLERWYLRKTPSQLRQVKQILWVTLLTIWIVGVSKIVFLPPSFTVVFLVVFLSLATVITICWVLPLKSTRLGQQYLQKLTQRYQQIQVQQSTYFDPIQLVALLGVVGLSNLEEFSPIQEAFVGITNAGNGTGNECGDSYGWLWRKQFNWWGDSYDGGN